MRRDVSATFQSASSGGEEERVKPGRDGTMMWYGRVSGVYLSRSRDMSGRNSRKEPGQPWKKAIGMADGLREKSAVKCMSNSLPSSSVILDLKAGKELMCSSSLRLVNVREVHGVESMLWD